MGSKKNKNVILKYVIDSLVEGVGSLEGAC